MSSQGLGAPAVSNEMDALPYVGFLMNGCELGNLGELARTNYIDRSESS